MATVLLSGGAAPVGHINLRDCDAPLYLRSNHLGSMSLTTNHRAQWFLRCATCPSVNAAAAFWQSGDSSIDFRLMDHPIIALGLYCSASVS